ncbi:EpsG family protein [Glaciimonas sp. PCH181]|nr:EpsG family protein [Glaciimonas sp. PCH181]
MYLLPVSFPGILRSMRIDTYKLGVWIAVGCLFTVIIGFRHIVGCDWWAYLDHYDTISKLPFSQALTNTDPAYATINWICAQFGLGIYGVNTICGVLAMSGLIRFVRKQPLPWLALAVAVPYLIIVIVMGYSRQGVAIGLVLWGLAVLRPGHIFEYIAAVILASLFHKTAIVMLPLALLHSSLSFRLRLLILVPLTGLAGYSLLSNSYDDLVKNYVVSQMNSDGGFIRILMNAVPAILFFALRKRWRRRWDDNKTWICFSFVSLISVPLVVLSSTATDRLALFLIPLQLVFYARLPLMFHGTYVRKLVILFIVAVYAMVLYIWLSRSYHAQLCWEPYRSVLFN